MNYENSLSFAREQDRNDVLKKYRNKFYIPIINGKESIYFAGNSLGLQPKSTQDYILKELENWANYGVEGHFYMKDPWFLYHDFFPEKIAKIIGGKPREVVVMNQLTVNIHLLMTAFYKPTVKRFKILCEAKAFPSDQYAFASQVLFHGFDPGTSIIEVHPRSGEYTLRTEDILNAIKENGNELALVFFGGINYYSGQVFDMAAITRAAHSAGVFCGFDLAHAIGNVELKLHEWEVDFAAWCSYKYLNSGPGGIAGAFINERYVVDNSLSRFTGWWGNRRDTRFKMEKDFKPIPAAEGWQLSTPSVIDMAAHKAAIDMFDEAGFDALLKKSKDLTGFALFILHQVNKSAGKEIIKVLTPCHPGERGCQLSLLISEGGKEIFDSLKSKGVIGDWREPNVIRIAPVPLYNSYEDVYWFGNILNHLCSETAASISVN